MIKANINEEILREKVIKLALLQHHKYYVHGMHGENNTFDCAGLVWYVYNELFNIDIYDGGYGLSTTTKIMTSNYGQLLKFNEVDKHIDLIKSGDILFFHRQSLNDNEPKQDNRYPGHCGIYLYDNEFIHALKSEDRVVISNFEQNKYWKKVLVARKDIISNISKKY